MKKQINIYVISFIILIGLALIIFYKGGDSKVQENQSERLVGDPENEGLILSHISQIEEEGYKVVHYDYNYSSNNAILKMQSHGSLKDELWTALQSLSTLYPNASIYTIEIRDERYTCTYYVNNLFFWDNIGDRLQYRRFNRETPPGASWVYASDRRKQIYVDEAYSAIDYIIQNNVFCVYQKE